MAGPKERHKYLCTEGPHTWLAEDYDNHPCPNCFAKLQAALKQAQEERDRLEQDIQTHVGVIGDMAVAMNTLEAERDMAIERGRKLIKGLYQRWIAASAAFWGQRELAEAAKRDLKDALEIKAHWKQDAEEQRALAERMQKGIEQLRADHERVHPCTLCAERLDAIFPAEALRARSPQSGQEEGD
jgi:hypothetical protein